MSTSRRTFCTQIGAGLGLAQQLAAGFDLKALRNAPGRVDPDLKELKLNRSWSGDLCRSILTNTGKQASG